jgi:radical SAM additional 4Fe4S-binding domain
MTDPDKIDLKFDRIIRNSHPLSGMLEVTGRCNARCPYCYVLQEHPEKELTTREVFLAIDKLVDAGMLYLGITGGEPFIRNDILDILSYVINKNIFDLTIFTNGTLLTEDHIRFLIDHKRYIFNLRISVFSHIADVHDEYTGVKNGLAAIISNARKLLAGNVNVTAIVNVLDFNKDSFEDTRLYFSAMGLHTDFGFNKIASPSTYASLAKPYISKEFYKNIFSTMGPDASSKFVKILVDKLADKKRPPNFCPGLYNDISIDYRGNITPCLTFRNMVIGSIFDKRGLLDIIRSSEDLRKLRSMTIDDIAECKECEFNSFCKVCPGSHHTIFGGFDHKPEQFCNFAQALNEIRTQVCNHIS